MKSRPVIYCTLLLLCIVVFLSCQPNTENIPDTSAAIARNIDSEMIKLADINIERLKVSQKILGNSFDARYSELIREYESNTDLVKKAEFIDRIIKEERFTCGDKPHPKEIGGAYPGIIRYSLDNTNFDLLVKNNDAFVAQVKFMNSRMQGLDTAAMNALSFYENLTYEQKKQYFEVPAGQNAMRAVPMPDFQKYIGRELARGYYHYQYHLQALFYNYYRQKTLKMLRGGANSQSARLMPDDKQFDIPVLASKN